MNHQPSKKHEPWTIPRQFYAEPIMARPDAELAFSCSFRSTLLEYVSLRSRPFLIQVVMMSQHCSGGAQGSMVRTLSPT